MLDAVHPPRGKASGDQPAYCQGGTVPDEGTLEPMAGAAATAASSGSRYSLRRTSIHGLGCQRKSARAIKPSHFPKLPEDEFLEKITHLLKIISDS
jgi:hypothetical protein